MRILCGNLRKIINNIQNEYMAMRSYLSPPVNLNTNKLPVKLAFNKFESKTTDPNANPLMVLHGFFGSKRNWKGRCIELENKTKRKVYAVDARNHGDSPHVPEHNLECMTDDIAFLMQKENLDKISIIGYSMGGRIAMHFALKYPELVEKAIVVDVSPISTPEDCVPIENIILTIKNMDISPCLSLADGRSAVKRRLLETIKVQSEIIDIILQNLKKLSSGDFCWSINLPVLYDSFRNFQPSPQYNMTPFRGPVLFMGAKRSNYIDPADLPKIKELFPNAKLEWLDAGHLVHFDQPKQFMELVTDFINDSNK